MIYIFFFKLQFEDASNKFHPGEKALIKEILEIVQECNRIRKFIKRYSPVDGPNKNYTGK